MKIRLRQNKLRRAASTVQIAVVLALLALGTMIGARLMGTSTEQGLDNNAGYFGDPSSVVNHFNDE